MRSQRPVFEYIAVNKQTLGFTEDDIEAIAENTVVSALTCASKVGALERTPILAFITMVFAGHNS